MVLMLKQTLQVFRLSVATILIKIFLLKVLDGSTSTNHLSFFLLIKLLIFIISPKIFNVSIIFNNIFQEPRFLETIL